jgi:hypothetical protein
MPTPAVALKLRKFRRRFGITAPNVVVRRHVSWHWYFFAASLIAIVMTTAVWFVLQRSDVGSISGELGALRLKVRELDDELLLLRSTAGTEQNVALMERSTQKELLGRLKTLEAENAALKEDMLLFERLIPIPGEEAVVRIENFRLTKDADSRFRYRLLIAFQPGKQMPDFKGRLQLALVYRLGEKEIQATLPDKKSEAADFSVDTKHFWRKEGLFELPLGAQLVRAEARVLQGDTLKSKRMAQL